MANKSFVVQYIIKAREQFAVAADKARAANDKMRASLEKTRTTMERVSKVGLGLGAAVSAPLILAARSAKNAARDAVEVRSKFDTVFRDVSATAQSTAQALAKDYGLTGTMARQLLGDTGDLLTGFGFTQEAALRLSNRVNQLAVDLASFTNYQGGTLGASEALTKALLGEREQLKSLGVAISEDLVKQKIQTLVAQGRQFATLQQAKAEATLMLAIEQSKNAIGDYARTLQDLANQERLTATRIQDLKESFGMILLPASLKLTQTIRRLAEWLNGLSLTSKQAVVAVGAIAAAAGPLLVLLAGIGWVIPAITAGFATLAPVVTAALVPVGALTLAAAGAAHWLHKNWAAVTTFLGGFKRGFDASAGPTLERLIGYFKETGQIIARLFGSEGTSSQQVRDFTRVGVLAGELIGEAFDRLIKNLEKVGKAISETVGRAVELLDKVGGLTSAAYTKASGFLPSPHDVLPDFLVKALESKSEVTVGVNVGLDRGLTQTTPVAVSRSGVQRANVGLLFP